MRTNFTPPTGREIAGAENDWERDRRTLLESVLCRTDKEHSTPHVSGNVPRRFAPSASVLVSAVQTAIRFVRRNASTASPKG